MDNTIEALADLYAVAGTPLAGHRIAVGRALERAVATRSGSVPPRGQWHGTMLPRKDGRMNFDPNGRLPQAQSASGGNVRADMVCGGMGGIRADIVCGSMGG